MGRNYVVLRRSPDWARFDIEDTRAFLASLGLDEGLIVRFAERWDADLALSFLGYRQAMKDLSLAGAHGVRSAEVVSHTDLADMSFADDDLLFFTDDDDWTHPDLFAPLRASGDAADGWLWRSIFVGKLLSDTRREKSGGAIVQERPASDIVYTNNYAVTGAAWKRLGPEHLLEHYSAHAALRDGLFAPDRVDDYLTAANKHICCTVCIRHNSGVPGFLDALPAALSGILADIDAVELSDRTRWIADPLERFAEINRLALKAA